MVMDARSGEVLHSRNADTRLHPASLTKMMTLYIVFEAVRLGEITMETDVTISRRAAATPYAIGFRAGTQVELRYLVRAAAVRSSNDAATAIAEAISGSEAAFARRMNRTAQALGMMRTTFRNPHGLTADGHMSTARDMTVLGRRLFYDYPQYYNIFGRRSTHAGSVGTVLNTNRALLDAYRGADGIKTGFTRAAGFNLVASAERRGERIIATVFGGNSAPSRNQRIMELLDMGFARAPSQVAVRRPALPVYADDGRAGHTIRASGAVSRSLRPVPRPSRSEDVPAELLAAIEQSVGDALARPPEEEVAATAAEDAGGPDPVAQAVADAIESLDAETEPAPEPSPDQLARIRPRPRPMPGQADTEIASAPEPDPAPSGSAASEPETEADVTLITADSPTTDQVVSPQPPLGIEEIVARAAPLEPEIVTRSTSSGSRLFGVSLGEYPTRNAAERLLLRIALAELTTFDAALRHVVDRPTGFEAQFAGMTEADAERACARLAARNVACETFGPS